MGSRCGLAAWDLARKYFDGSIVEMPFGSELLGSAGELELGWQAERGAFYLLQESTDLGGGFTDVGDWMRAEETWERLLLPPPTPESPRRFFRVVRSFEPV